MVFAVQYYGAERMRFWAGDIMVRNEVGRGDARLWFGTGRGPGGDITARNGEDRGGVI